MREINLRGLDRNAKKWTYFDVTMSRWGPILQPCRDDAIETEVSVDPETITQYIGIKDRSNIEVYDGDICNWYYNKVMLEAQRKDGRKDYEWNKTHPFWEKWVMEWNEGAHCWRTPDLWLEPEIIGNIFENKITICEAEVSVSVSASEEATDDEDL